MTDYTKLAAEQLAAEHVGADLQTHWPAWVVERARALKAEAELEAFKQEVSDAVKDWDNAWNHRPSSFTRAELLRFILPDPQPTLADVCAGSDVGRWHRAGSQAEALTEAAARLGVEIIVKRKEG
jgi:hypothetical protein